MIISHKHKFIFIKTNKTAGTSVEIALSKFCGPYDVITPISPEDELLRGSLGYRGPQNYRGGNGEEFYNHISAKEIKMFVEEQVWANYYKFCFERNPWDRLISLYYWRYQSEPRPSINEFLSTNAPFALKCKGRDLYTINGEVVVDKVCRFEDITEELEMIRMHLGISEPVRLPRAKSKYRKDRRHYRDILSNIEKAKVENFFSEEIKRFKYKF